MKGPFALDGSIVGIGFESGDRFVIGLWDEGPLGPMDDVMWARPDGTRVLLAPRPEVRDFVSSLYEFDHVQAAPFAVRRDDARLDLRAGPLAIRAVAGRSHVLFRLRPRMLRRSLWWVRFEDLLFRRFVGRVVLKGAEGVRAFGTTPRGARQWYRIDDYRLLVAGSAAIEGRDLGRMTSLGSSLGFGASEFPQRPAWIRCSPVIVGATVPTPSGVAADAPHRR